MQLAVPIIFGVKTSPPKPVFPLEYRNCPNDAKPDSGLTAIASAMRLREESNGENIKFLGSGNMRYVSQMDVMVTGTCASSPNSLELCANAVSRLPPSLTTDSAGVAPEQRGMRQRCVVWLHSPAVLKDQKNDVVVGIKIEPPSSFGTLDG
ncbi:hypothetical protein DFH06DRAFT_1117964 [Mycena polygramma]|nr:hypothetical protein DFH06DRAFT_1117964 [Mycena polygramma]